MTMVLTTSFKLAKEAGACKESYKKMARHLGGVRKYGGDTTIPITQVLDVCGLDDALWALAFCSHAPDTARRLLRLYACDSAERVLYLYENAYPGDVRPRQAIEVARRYVDGQATEEERAAARAAAWDAAWDAGDAAWDAGDAAGAAARAAWAAARVAALDAAGAATRAAWAAAWDAALTARVAALDAGDDARAAWSVRDAGDAEREWQTNHLREILADGSATEVS